MLSFLILCIPIFPVCALLDCYLSDSGDDNAPENIIPVLQVNAAGQSVEGAATVKCETPLGNSELRLHYPDVRVEPHFLENLLSIIFYVVVGLCVVSTAIIAKYGISAFFFINMRNHKCIVPNGF